MASREQVQELIDAGHTFETAGRELGIPPGRAFMIATGRPAEGLVNPPPFNPLGRAHVMPWVRARAARELAGRRR